MSTMKCKQFLDNGADRITLLLAWLDGFYSKSDNAKLDTEAYVIAHPPNGPTSGYRSAEIFLDTGRMD